MYYVNVLFISTSYMGIYYLYVSVIVLVIYMCTSYMY